MMIQASEKEAKILKQIEKTTDINEKTKLLDELAEVHTEEMKKYQDITFTH